MSMHVGRRDQGKPHLIMKSTRLHLRYGITAPGAKETKGNFDPFLIRRCCTDD